MSQAQTSFMQALTSLAPQAGQAGPAQGQGNGGMADGLTSLLSGKGGIAAGAAAGGLVGLLIGGKRPKKIAKTALKVGGAALVGGLAYKAWQNWQNGKQAGDTPPAHQPADPTPEFLPVKTEDRAELDCVLIKAMIAAVKADGLVSQQEKEALAARAADLGLGPESAALIEAELEDPQSLNEIVMSVETPEQGAEIYTASLLAIDPSGSVERAYLDLLAARLGLEPALTAHLEASVLEAERSIS